jgi:hypothetical protein
MARSASGTKRTRRTHGLMSAFRGKPDSTRTWPQSPLMTQSGHFVLANVLSPVVRMLRSRRQPNFGHSGIARRTCSPTLLAGRSEPGRNARLMAANRRWPISLVQFCCLRLARVFPLAQAMSGPSVSASRDVLSGPVGSRAACIRRRAYDTEQHRA